jgi:hypothetical protein
MVLAVGQRGQDADALKSVRAVDTGEKKNRESGPRFILEITQRSFQKKDKDDQTIQYTLE